MPALRYSHRARDDLTDLWLHIAKQSPDIADRVIDRIEQRCRILRDYPEAGPARPDIDPTARVLVIESWLIIYRILERTVEIVRVVDGARDLSRVNI
jgi:toxin ParE1/3/4